MNSDALKLELVRRLLNTKDENIIKHLKAIFDTRQENWFNELPNEIRSSVQRGLKQSSKKETISHEEAKKQYGKWLKK